MDTTPGPVSLGSLERPRAAAIFLHAGWRSCGTWLWESLRDRDSVRAYYEPLHEDLTRLDRAALTRFSPDSWRSGHSPGAPYFAEFVPHVRPVGRGIAGYQARFAFDDFFFDPACADVALAAYLRGLIAAAQAERRLPVLKFCRSLGRVPWMAAHFPDAWHAVVLRDPVAQWMSARRLMEQAKNRYFVLAPFIILARNASHPLLAEAIARLDVPMPPHLSHALGITTQVCWQHVQRLGWTERYRGFLALWTATSLVALRGGTAVIDADRMAGDAAHRAEMEAKLEDAAGLRHALFRGYAREPGSAWLGSADEARDAAQAAFAALDFIAGARADLPAARVRLLVAKLAPRFHDAACVRAVLPHAPPRPHPLPVPLRKLDAALYVAVARLTYPLRRLHYYARRGWAEWRARRR